MKVSSHWMKWPVWTMVGLVPLSLCLIYTMMNSPYSISLDFTRDPHMYSWNDVLTIEPLNELQIYVAPWCASTKSMWVRIWNEIHKWLEAIFFKIDCWCKRNHHCAKLHLKLGPISNLVRWLQFCLQDLTAKLVGTNEDIDWMTTNGTFTVKNSEIVMEEDEDEENKLKWLDLSVEDDQHSLDEMELELTREVNVTRETRATATPPSKIVSQLLLFDDMTPSNQTDLVQREFKAWSRAITTKLHTIITNLHKDNEFLINETSYNYNVSYTMDYQNLFQDFDSQLVQLHQSVDDIDTSATLDPITNEIVYLNSENTYITRPYIASRFDNLNQLLKQHRLETLANLRKLRKLTIRELEKQRDEHVEVYEEWGDVMVTEWSKRMAYGDIHGGNDDRFELDKWGHFKKLRESIIAMRDNLAQEPVFQDTLVQYMKVTVTQLNDRINSYHTKIAQLLQLANNNFEQRDLKERNVASDLAETITKELI
ncbi:similar to Saccharomyces cerevisiae YGL228W SHE10 Putative glycosylphosphatidylinositol (GPI)-anchored protein of unknown function [Maudiozyma saulgeensis]|uniref:Uncharacterized protein n=1 Tax=Maudiozyma saulgeensis TaxID=1789683 RepID=A0A1X7RBY7_9SACH|nr:similar to Saccharomyces cerevisiae YGL228W SHE10 Putative glycosylphosphatidylinositol (GPI)-anchored protein of unknown function [Kazachstania saulgeensis]